MAWTEVTAPQVPLTKGQTYSASLVLTGVEALLGSVDAVKAKFQDMGFTSVTVWEAPPAWMPDQSRPTSGHAYWARGTWGMGSATRAMPSQVKRVWRSDPDTPAPAVDDTWQGPPPSANPSLDPKPAAAPPARATPATASEDAPPNVVVLAILAALLFMGGKR
jgi:hypothetical protein